MNDPTPLFALLIAQALALLALVGWWAGLPLPDRAHALRAVMVYEHVDTAPPDGWIAPATWLATHRMQRLQGMLGLVGLAGLLGAGEGVARRRTDVLGGFLLRWWTAGVVGLALVPGAVAGYLLAPWPLAGGLAASALALLAALILYGLTAGRPYIP